MENVLNETISRQPFIHQSVYARKLHSQLPKEAFQPNISKLVVLVLNLAILGVGWTIARQLDSWPPYLLWLYLPFALTMGNSVIVLLFSSHDLLHGSVIRKPRLGHFIGLIGLAMLWMPPSLWKILHNRVHHNNTNSVADPDRNYLAEQPTTWGKRIQNVFVPSAEVSPVGLIIGMPFSWGIYTFRNLTSALLFNRSDVSYVPAAFSVKPSVRRAIFLETIALVFIHLGILAYLQFSPLKLLLAYFLPIGLGYSGLIFYIYTNHLACPMTPVNDPLKNSVSIQVAKIFDLLHLNFSYHAEHHIFPSLNSDYYPVVRELLRQNYPQRMGYVVTAKDAWQTMLKTPRFYQDDCTLTDWHGVASVPCPLPLSSSEESGSRTEALKPFSSFDKSAVSKVGNLS